MESRLLQIEVQANGGTRTIAFPVREVVIAGWSGRSSADVEAHIAELEAIGVQRPATTPLFYRVSRELITSAAEIQVVGPDSSGEAECVLLIGDDEIYVSIGSDHTDRRLERISVSQAKQVCPKPVGSTAWRFSDVRDHWDKLTIESKYHGDGSGIYQSGPASSLRHPDDLLRIFKERGGETPPGTIMFCGTVPIEGEIRFADALELSLKDPVLKRELTHRYQPLELPLLG
jgi:hypothetical protein